MTPSDVFMDIVQTCFYFLILIIMTLAEIFLETLLKFIFFVFHNYKKMSKNETPQFLVYGLDVLIDISLCLLLPGAHMFSVYLSVFLSLSVFASICICFLCVSASICLCVCMCSMYTGWVIYQVFIFGRLSLCEISLPKKGHDKLHYMFLFVHIVACLCQRGICMIPTLPMAARLTCF